MRGVTFHYKTPKQMFRVYPCTGGNVEAREVQTDARLLLIENYIHSSVPFHVRKEVRPMYKSLMTSIPT